MKNLLREPDRGLGGTRNPHVRKVHSGCYVPSAHRCDSLATILKSNCTQNYEKLEVSK